MKIRHLPATLCSLFCLSVVAAHAQNPDSAADWAQSIIDATEFTGGLIVHINSKNADRTAALQNDPNTVVHGLISDPEKLAEFRRQLNADGKYGPVSLDHLRGGRLPYADNLAALVIAENPGGVSAGEAMRVLRPDGAVCVGRPGAWKIQRKPWPGEIDQWTHYLRAADNNAVAHDQKIGPPRSLQWIGSPRWARHHDRMASMSAMVTANGRVFYIFDEGSTASILLPSRWSLIARDAFSGIILWKQPIPDWQTRMWRLKSGPAQLPRRLVVDDRAVYATLGIDVPVTAIDPVTGKILRSYPETRGTEEILISNGTLFCVTDSKLDTSKYTQADAIRKPWWTGKTVRIISVDAETGKVNWTHLSPVAPLTAAVDQNRVVFHDGDRVVCLNRINGEVLWNSKPLELVKKVMSFFAPTLVIQHGVVLYAGGEESGLVKSGGGATKNDTISALDADTGKVLWQAEHLPSGYSSPEDVFVLDDAVWYASVSNGKLPGMVIGHDLRTGAVKAKYESANVDTFWFHHRCYRGKATDNYLMVSRTGIEFIDPKTGDWNINHWARGGCLYGIMPANGMIYCPPHDCACYPESKMFGLNVLTAEPPEIPEPLPPRIEQGPAYNKQKRTAKPADSNPAWPTFRADLKRSGHTAMQLADKLEKEWSLTLGSALTAVTVAENAVFAVDKKSHTVHAVDAANGTPIWEFVTGGPVDSPPTIYKGLALFGCSDGWIYCLDAKDGRMVWRFRAAPIDSRIMAFEQLTSRWPVHGSVLVMNDTVYAVAGRSLFLDGGMRFLRLDVHTGELLSEKILDNRDPASGKDIQQHVQRLTMPVALPDVLSSDRNHIYMRSQVFDTDGKRRDITPHGADKLGAHAAIQKGDTAHLFASAGFLDDTWFHRAYWVYGRSFEGGWNSYYLAGKKTPAGKILVTDGRNVYGFGREMRYYRWTVPMEHQLFASPMDPSDIKPRDEAPKGSIIRIEKSNSLSPANQALTISAWIRAEAPDGVILAHGGRIMGYSLYLKDRRPQFAVSAKSKQAVVTDKRPVGKSWTHLAGVLTKKSQLQLYVNGKLAATGKAPGLVPENPADIMQVGADEGSRVGNHKDALPFKGDIDEIRLYHGKLNENTIRALSEAQNAVSTDIPMVLHYTFDDKPGHDNSGKKNHGTAVGGSSVPGRIGKAYRFEGHLPGQTPKTNRAFTWNKKIPILVRGMLKAGRVLAVAGPEDLVDEPSAMKRLDSKETRAVLKAQEKAMNGKSGALLFLIDSANGEILSSEPLSAPPVWDGLAAAYDKLYITDTSGSLHCYRSR